MPGITTRWFVKARPPWICTEELATTTYNIQGLCDDLVQLPFHQMEPRQQLEERPSDGVLCMNKPVWDTEFINVLVGRHLSYLEAAKWNCRFDLLERYKSSYADRSIFFFLSSLTPASGSMSRPCNCFFFFFLPQQGSAVFVCACSSSGGDTVVIPTKGERKAPWQGQSIKIK